MKTPTTPNLARYFSECGLTLHCSIEFEVDGRRKTYWGLSQAETGKPFWPGERKVFSSTCDLWRAWRAYQLRLHLQHAQALRFVRYFLRNEQQHLEPFNAWLSHNATAKSARADDVDTTGLWPWTSAQTSLDRRTVFKCMGDRGLTHQRWQSFVGVRESRNPKDGQGGPSGWHPLIGNQQHGARRPFEISSKTSVDDGSPQ